MATVRMPRAASAWFSCASLVRSPLFHAPPCTSTMVGNGPTPSGRYTRASLGVPSSCWYSTSLTSDKASKPAVVAIRASVLSGRDATLRLNSVRSRADARGVPLLDGLHAPRQPRGHGHRDDDGNDRCPEYAQALKPGHVGPACQDARVNDPGRPAGVDKSVQVRGRLRRELAISESKRSE